VENNEQTGPGNDPLLSRAHVEHILHRTGLDEGQQMAVLDGIDFPSPLSKVTAVFLQHGISYSSLTDQMGGSP
jgi:hypothetical protein